MRLGKRSPVRHASRRANDGIANARPRGRRLLGACAALLAIAAQTPIAHADQRDDFLAGRTRACPRCDLSGENFKRRDLANADLTGASLKEANLHDARLTGARLAGADLSSANLNKANLSRADLAGAKLREAMLYAANLDGAKLAGADLTKAEPDGRNCALAAPWFGRVSKRGQQIGASPRPLQDAVLP
jgi:uncharacterized protein YjbI with pentapeptide repeats